MGSSSTDRCGYTWTDSSTDGKPSQGHCCYRETFEDADRCIWHTDPDETGDASVEALQAVRAPPDIREQNRPFAELLDGATLSNIDIDEPLSFANTALRDASFTDATLADSDFTGADLSNGYFLNTAFKDATFTDATLKAANFHSANLTNADFSGADLNNTYLYNADLTGTGFEDAQLSDTHLMNATLNNAYLPDVDLTGVSLQRADLTDAVLPDATLEGTDLSNATLRDVVLSGADLSHAILSDTDLSDGVLQDATLTEADLSGAILDDVNFRRATLTDANVQEASLVSATLADADLHGANLNRASLENTDLIGTDLTQAYLFGATFDGARISGQTKFNETTIGDATDKQDYCRYDLEIAPEDPSETIRNIEDELEEPADIVQLRRGRSTYRRLEELAKQNGFPDVQSTMFKRRQEMRRHLLKKQGETLKYWFAEVQRALFVYGESFSRVLLVSAGVITISWMLFSFTGTVSQSDGVVLTPETIQQQPALLGESLQHSLLLFFTGAGVLEPTGPLGSIIATFEVSAGPILLALLIFVLGRRSAR